MQFRRALGAIAVLSTGVASVLGGCAPGEPIGGPAGSVTIGLLTDRGSETGAAAVRAAQLAVDLVNEPHPEIALPLAGRAGLPGLAGAPLVLAVADTAGEPAAAEVVMEQLVADAQPAGFVAADAADVTAVAGAYADRRRVPLLDGVTSAGFLLEVGLDWYFRVTATDRARVEAAFALLAAAPGAPDAAAVTVLAAGPGGGTDLVPLVPEVARGAGFTLAGTVTVASAMPAELATATAQLAGSRGPVVAVAATAAEAELLRQVLSQVEPARPLVGLGRGFGAGQTVVPDLAYPADWSASLAQRHPLAQAVTDLYQQRHQAQMTETAATVFTATLVLALALDTAGSTDPAAVRASLRQLSVPATQLVMPWYGVRFGDDGQNRLAAAVMEQHTASGPILVYPPELALAPVAWPAPAAPATGGAP